VYLSYRFVTSLCTISTSKSIPMEIWCFMVMCYHLNVYKQQDFSRFIVKLCSKLINYGKSTSEDEMDKGIKMLEAGRSQRQVAHVLGVSQCVFSRMQFSNATTLRTDFQNARGVRISTQTVGNRLHNAGLRSWWPAFAFF
jgi:hypothetical protein